MSNPFEDTIATLDGQSENPAITAASQAQSSASGNPFEDAATQLSSDAPAPGQGVQGAGTPESPFKAIISFSQKIQEAREVGTLGFRESAMGHAVAAGHMTLEEAEKQIGDDDRMAQLSGDLEAYEKEAWDSWITGIPTSIAISTVKQLPILEESLKPFAAGAALGGGAAVATGAGAPFAVPVAGMTGTAVAAGWAADLIIGQEYLQRRRQGIPHNEALAASNISGVVQGMLQAFQVGRVGKVALDTAKHIANAHLKTMANFLVGGLNVGVEGAKFGALQIGVGEAQTATKLIADALAATISKTPDAVPTLEEAAKEFSGTFQETLKSSVGLFVGGKAIGTGAGLSGKALLKVLKKTHDVHLEKQTAKQEKILTAQDNTVNSSVNSGSSISAPEDVQSTPSKRQATAAVRLEKRLAAEVEINRIFSAADSMFTIDTPESRLKEVGRIQRLLKRMVANSDKLDDAMKVKLLKRITEIDGVKALLKEGAQFIDDQRGREYANDLKAAETRLRNAIDAGKMKKQKAKLPLEAQATINWYKEFFAAPKIEEQKVKGAPKAEPGEQAAKVKEAALKKALDYVDRGIEEEKKQLQDQVALLEQNKLAEIFNPASELAEKRRIATEAAQYWSDSLDADGVNSLAEKIEKIVDTGKSEFLERKKAESTRLLTARAEILTAVNGVKPVVPSTSKSQPKQLNSVGQLVNSVRRNSSALWDKLLQDLPADRREPIVRRVLDFTEVENREAAINIKSAEKMTNLYADAVGSISDANRLIKDGVKNERFTESYTDATGVSQILGRHTLNELVYLHNAFKDPGAVPGLVNGNKFTLDGMVEVGHTSTQTAVRELLTTRADGKYLKLADAVIDFYKWFAPTVGNHYLKEYGVEMPISEGYSGRIHHRGVEKLQSAADILDSAHSYAKQSLNPASTKLRNNSKMPLKLVDPFAEVQRHRSQMAFWIANSEKARLLSFIFSDTKQDGLRDVIEHKLGKEFTGLIDGRLAFQFHLKPGIMDIGDRAFQWIKGNMATGLLGMRPDQAPKQMTSVLAALSTNSFPEFVDGLRGAMDKKRVQEYISRSELYADRQNDVLSKILDATTERSYVDTITGDRALAIKEFGLKPVSWADGVASAITGFIEYNRVRKAGGSIEEAVLAGDSLIDRSQSSSRASQKVPAEFKGGIGNLSLAFAKQGIQMVNLESGAMRDWFIHRDQKHLARVARTVVGIHTAQVLFQAINSVPTFLVGDEKEQTEAQLRLASAALSGPYGQLPLIGIDVFYGALSGWKGQQTPRTIIGGLAGDSAKFVKQMYSITEKLATGEEIDGEDWTKAFRSTASVASVLTGLPFWGLFKYTELGSKVVGKANGEE